MQHIFIARESYQKYFHISTSFILGDLDRAEIQSRRLQVVENCSAAMRKPTTGVIGFVL